MLDRRAFLRRLGFGTVAAAAAATGVLDVERLLWMPGEKTIFIPEPVVDGFVTIDWLTKETLAKLKNELKVSMSFQRDFDEMLADRPAKIRISRRWLKMSVAD